MIDRTHIRRLVAVAVAACAAFGAAAPSALSAPPAFAAAYNCPGKDVAEDAIKTHQPYGVGGGRKIG